jgi:hypothetical protein
VFAGPLVGSLRRTFDAVSIWATLFSSEEGCSSVIEHVADEALGEKRRSASSLPLHRNINVLPRVSQIFCASRCPDLGDIAKDVEEPPRKEPRIRPMHETRAESQPRPSFRPNPTSAAECQAVGATQHDQRPPGRMAPTRALNLHENRRSPLSSFGLPLDVRAPTDCESVAIAGIPGAL